MVMRRARDLGLGLIGGAIVAWGGAPQAWAGSFDGRGVYTKAPDAAAFVGYSSNDFDPLEDRILPSDLPVECLAQAVEVIEGDDALEGDSYLHVNTTLSPNFCVERLRVEVPAGKGSYRARLWMRHGAVSAQMTVTFPDELDRDPVAAAMAPTGRTTSDGWVELASNPFPIDADAAEAVYLRVYDYDSTGSDIDALELVPEGDYWESQPCEGVRDPVCGEGAVCVHQRCRLGRLAVPPLPDDAIRGRMVDVMQSQLRVFYGGRKTRLEDLPESLAILDSIRQASDPWTFWNGWATAIRTLHDWHTSASSGFSFDRRRRLNVCFIEGEGDTSAASWPADAAYPDILVSHTGQTSTQGLSQGDRLVAVDGMHPIAWALSLKDVDWGYWTATDAEGYAEAAERMRGLIPAYAKSFSVIHCDSGAQTCDATPVTIDVASIRAGGGGGMVRCDNRPFYHLQSDNPSNHNVGWNFFRGKIQDTTDEEAIYGMVWDTLYGGGNPNGHVNSNITQAIADFKANARGVILDHRAGSGGTIDAAENVTKLVRPVETALIFHSPLALAGDDGPENDFEGLQLFQKHQASSGMTVGAADHDPDLPVALILHRDGSASDFMPQGMKGAPKTRLFGPHATAGAFSTFYEMRYWGGLSYQFASGDAISKEGKPLIGHGVVPDVVLLPKQSDLLAGKDTLHEAALAWVRQELKAP